jgi:hypothetical protein
MGEGAKENYNIKMFLKKGLCGAGCQWLMPVILAIQEAEIRRIIV